MSEHRQQRPQFTRALVILAFCYVVGAVLQAVLFPADAVLADELYLLAVPFVILMPCFLGVFVLTLGWRGPPALGLFAVLGLVIGLINFYSWFPPLLVIVVVVAAGLSRKYATDIT